MNNFNFSVLEGRLVKDPVLETVKGNMPLCKFTVAVNRSFTKKTGEKIDEVAFFDVTTWFKLGETCGRYLKKGSRVLVSGLLKRDSWNDKEGKPHSRVYVEGKEVNFLSSPREAQPQEA